MRREFLQWAFLSLSLLTLTPPAMAQGPHIPNMAQRSGLLGRYAPTMHENLPHDPDRDTFFGTYYGDRPVAPGTNCLCNGGLYGQRLNPGCVTCHNPFFYGANGQPKAQCPQCQPAYKHPLGRTAASLFHPRRPVGHYYQNGCQVPIYDLDPLVPGPGPDLWPFYHNGFIGG